MSEMIERVARAFYESHPWGDEDGAGVHSWESLPEDWRAVFMGGARAAIEAWREPTMEMWTHAMPHVDSLSSIAAFWQAMIDAALKEQP